MDVHLGDTLQSTIILLLGLLVTRLSHSVALLSSIQTPHSLHVVSQIVFHKTLLLGTASLLKEGALTKQDQSAVSWKDVGAEGEEEEA